MVTSCGVSKNVRSTEWRVTGLKAGQTEERTESIVGLVPATLTRPRAQDVAKAIFRATVSARMAGSRAAVGGARAPSRRLRTNGRRYREGKKE
jgi:hypothetical protein